MSHGSGGGTSSTQTQADAGSLEMKGFFASEAGYMARFGAVSALNFGASYLLFLLFLEIPGLSFDYAYALSYLAWLWFGFVLQRRLVFRQNWSSSIFVKYLLSQAAFMFAGLGIFAVLVRYGSVRPEISYLVAVGTLAASYYIIARVIVFGERGLFKKILPGLKTRTSKSRNSEAAPRRCQAGI